MRRLVWLLPLFLCAAPAWAGGVLAIPTTNRTRQVSQEAIRAATGRATDDLYDQIARLPLNARANVGQFVKSLNAENEFLKTLARADQIGSPRWIDAQTCQVQLEISAARVGLFLKQLTAAFPMAAPATAADIDLAMQRWPRRTFFSTGSSASMPSLAEYRPTNPRWFPVADDLRRRALAQAGDAAIRRVLESVGPVPLSDGVPLSAGLAIPDVRQFVTDWLAECPVTRVDFRDDLAVEVTLAVDPAGLFDVARAALERQTLVRIPGDDETWALVLKNFSAKFAPAVGRASAGVAVGPQIPQLPRRAPDWVNQSIDVQGIGAGPTKLKSALAAESDARDKLRGRLESLELAPRLTARAAALQTPTVAVALDRAVDRAQITSTQYFPDGSAAVQLSLDLGGFWDEIGR